MTNPPPFTMVKVSFESFVNKKPNGKLASLYLKAKNGDAGAKAYFSKIYGDKNYVTQLFADNTVEKQEAAQNKDGFEASFAPKALGPVNSALNSIEKTKKAYKMSLDMQKRGLLKEGEESLNKQINSFMNMDTKSFDAYTDSLENLSPSRDVEEGRFRISMLEKPMIIAQGKCIAAGFVDNKFVGYLTDLELNAENGRVTRGNLKVGISHLATALDKGMLDGILSDYKTSAKDGEEVDITVGQTDKPMFSTFDIDKI